MLVSLQQEVTLELQIIANNRKKPTKYKHSIGNIGDLVNRSYLYADPVERAQRDLEHQQAVDALARRAQDYEQEDAERQRKRQADAASRCEARKLAHEEKERSARIQEKIQREENIERMKIAIEKQRSELHRPRAPTPAPALASPSTTTASVIQQGDPRATMEKKSKVKVKPVRKPRVSRAAPAKRQPLHVISDNHQSQE